LEEYSASIFSVKNMVSSLFGLFFSPEDESNIFPKCQYFYWTTWCHVPEDAAVQRCSTFSVRLEENFLILFR
jgi:hypothetical protein